MENEFELPPELAELNESGATDDETARACLTLLRDEHADPEHRGIAVRMLGPGLQLGEEVIDWSDPWDCYFSKSVWDEVRDTLKSLYHDPSVPKAVRRGVLECAVRGPVDDWVMAAIGAAWESGDDDWLLTAVFTGNFVDGFDEEFRAVLSKPPSEEILMEAIFVIANNEMVEHLGVLESIASGQTDHSREIRLAAIEALGCVGFKNISAWTLIEELSLVDDAEIVESASIAEEEYLMRSALYDEFNDL